jgi:hypothetical protein
LVATLFSLTGGRLALAADDSLKEAAFSQRVKAEVAKLGTGPSASVEVKLRNKAKLKDYIQAVNENSFVVVDSKTGATTEVPYPQVKQVKGNNLSTGAKVAIGVGIGIVILLLIFKDRIKGS